MQHNGSQYKSIKSMHMARNVDLLRGAFLGKDLITLLIINSRTVLTYAGNMEDFRKQIWLICYIIDQNVWDKLGLLKYNPPVIVI